MKELEKKITEIGSISGIIITFLVLIYSSILLNKVNLTFVFGILGSVLGSFISYFLFYIYFKKDKFHQTELFSSPFFRFRIGRFRNIEKRNIFISFTLQNKELAYKLSKDLDIIGYHTQQSRVLKIGVFGDKSTLKAINNADYYLDIQDWKNFYKIPKKGEFPIALNAQKKILPLSIICKDPKNPKRLVCMIGNFESKAANTYVFDYPELFEFIVNLLEKDIGVDLESVAIKNPHNL